MAPFGPAPAMVGKETSLSSAGVAAKALERRDDVDFGQLAARRLSVEPGQKARDGDAVAPVRRCGADDLGRGSWSLSAARSGRSA